MEPGEIGHRVARSAAGAAPRWRRWALGAKPVERVALALLAVGCLLRALHFLGGRSLWLDEAMVAESIVHRDWAGLLLPLEYNQIAPLGWLWIERASFVLLGGSDLALRAPAFVAGIGSLLLFAWVARRSLAPYGGLLAIAAFAASGVLVRFSAEVKPYGFDALVAVVGLALAVRYFHKGEPFRVRDLVLLLLAGLASLLVSFPAAFVLAGIGGALFLRAALERRWTDAAWVAILSAAWLLAFAWLVLRLRQGASVNVAEMTTSWDGAFAPIRPDSLGELKWFAKALMDMLEYMFGQGSMIAWLVAIVIGSVLSFRSTPYLCVALITPLAVALAASGLQLYPFSGRLLVFALPAMVFLAVVGAQAAIAAFKAPLAGSLVAGVLLLYGPANRLWGEFTYYPAPFATEQVLPVMRTMSEQSDVEAVYVNRDGLPAFRYYRQRSGLAGVPVIPGRALRNSLGCLLADMEIVSRHRRVWVFYSHAGRVIGDTPEDSLFRYFADATGRRLQSIDLISVHAYLYEFDEAGARRLSAIRMALSAAGACDVPQGTLIPGTLIPGMRTVAP